MLACAPAPVASFFEPLCTGLDVMILPLPSYQMLHVSHAFMTFNNNSLSIDQFTEEDTVFFSFAQALLLPW
jgi:hypothetical protein